jgi:heme A synthase
LPKGDALDAARAFVGYVPAAMTRPSVAPVGFRRLAWGVLGYTVLVILWGAFVRASGSGAGCGDHWPLCNGEVVPTSPTFNTAVEFGHRVTSALAGLAALVLAWAAFRATPRGSPVRKAALWSLFFMVTEGAIGAALVLFEFVAYNPSIGRAYWMAAHLANTFLLLGALTLTAWWAEGGSVPRLRADRRTAWVGAALVATLILGAGGAVTALGDTLVVGGGLDPETDPVVGALVAARVFHPTMAFVALGVLAGAVVASRPAGPRVTQMGMAVLGLFVAQMGLGALNVWLMAPIWMQIVHLLVTDVIWVGLVVFAAEALAAPVAEPAEAAVPVGT